MEQTTEKPRSKKPEEFTFFDTELLIRHVTDTGKILPRRITQFSARQQRHVTKTIKRARALLLMK
ncbi:MAG TPA: 30S ribosomal protein S18 [Opitutales bacterium]|nr:30S ribosomal protein S18 [Opitutales bacterium]